MGAYMHLDFEGPPQKNRRITWPFCNGGPQRSLIHPFYEVALDMTKGQINSSPPFTQVTWQLISLKCKKSRQVCDVQGVTLCILLFMYVLPLNYHLADTPFGAHLDKNEFLVG